jgi:hypothetical protein
VDARPWLERFENELRKRKLPPLYVERLLSELSDHFYDSLEDPMSTDAKDLRTLAQHVGSPRDIAATAAKEYRRAHICRRHPIVTFVLLPILALPILWAASLIVIIALAKAFGLETGGEGIGGTVWRWASINAPLVVLGVLIVPIGIAAAAFCGIVARAGVSWQWTLAACAILALVGGMAMVNIVLPGVADGGRVTFGLGLGAHPTEAQLLQFALPLGMAAWAIWRQSGRSRATIAS